MKLIWLNDRFKIEKWEHLTKIYEDNCLVEYSELPEIDWWVIFDVETEFVEPYWKLVTSFEIDNIYNFSENDKEYIIDWDIYPKAEYKNLRFFQLNKECWHCWKIHLFSDIISQWFNITSWNWDTFVRDFNFCSEECIENYLNENTDITKI